jgi:hypothetical protein
MGEAKRLVGIPSNDRYSGRRRIQVSANLARLGGIRPERLDGAVLILRGRSDGAVDGQGQIAPWRLTDLALVEKPRCPALERPRSSVTVWTSPPDWRPRSSCESTAVHRVAIPRLATVWLHWAALFAQFCDRRRKRKAPQRQPHTS